MYCHHSFEYKEKRKTWMKSRIHSRSCGETTESFDDVSVVKMGKDFLSIFTSRMYVSRYIIRISLADGHFQSCLLNTYIYVYDIPCLY